MSASSDRLRRGDELELSVRTDGTVVVRRFGGSVVCPRHGLAVLDAFAEPRSIREALDLLGARAASAEDWIELSGLVVQLRDAGVLVPADRPVSAATHQGFASPVQHVLMLQDRARTKSFLDAIAEVVGPEDVVLEIGAGSGVLSTGAARAGARHVYAIEGTLAADWAEAVYRANGVADRVTLVRGWSTAVTIPEPASILVTETVGNEALEEGIVEWVVDARRRLLAPGARIVPAAIRIFGVGLAIPNEVVARGQFTDVAAARWQELYGIDFGPLVGRGAGCGSRFLADAGEVLAWEAMTEPIELARIDLATVTVPTVDVQALGVASRDGSINAATLWFDLELSPGVHLERSWDSGDPENSWGIPIWTLPEPVVVTAGDVVRMDYRYRVPGVPRQDAVRLAAATEDR